MEERLSEDDRRALRGSKFAPLPPSKSQPRLAHPGGPVTTNKAAALAKFLERKLQQPGGIDTINPDLLQVAVDNAKETVNRSIHGGSSSSSGRVVRHVTSFGDSSDDSGSGEGEYKIEERKLKKRKRKEKKKKKEDSKPKSHKTIKLKKSTL